MGRYLSKVVPGTVGMEPKTVGPKLTLEFSQKVRGRQQPVGGSSQTTYPTERFAFSGFS